jgi:hypothetical protein
MGEPWFRSKVALGAIPDERTTVAHRARSAGVDAAMTESLRLRAFWRGRPLLSAVTPCTCAGGTCSSLNTPLQPQCTTLQTHQRRTGSARRRCGAGTTQRHTSTRLCERVSCVSAWDWTQQAGGSTLTSCNHSKNNNCNVLSPS